MVELSYTLSGQKHNISRESIVNAMKRFDQEHHGARPRRGTKYFVWWRGKPYPPKDILRRMKNGPSRQFSGGHATNQIFRDLEFYVGKGHFPERQPGTNTPIPTIAALTRSLFARPWSIFKKNFLDGPTGKYPGIYLFALSVRNLENKPIEFEDIFYVGSSCTATNVRLNQFYNGTKRNCCHSAAMRFHERWRKRSRQGQQFYVAVVTIPCETRKEIRTEKDLRKMGRVAELEYAVLGQIKQQTGFEPLLNRK